jgi:SAM-dependent methyltransferase
MSLSPAALRELILDSVLAPGFGRATFGGAIRGNRYSSWIRVTLRPVELRGILHLQFSYFDGKKDFAKNFSMSEVEIPLKELVEIGYSGLHIETAMEIIDIRTSKKGKIFVGRKSSRKATVAAEPHNRIKDVPLPEGCASRLLEVMGIASADGRVRPTMRAKFTQINEFLKQLMHVFDDAGLRSLGRPLEILDCGCGSSYLTLAAHHYLNNILIIPANIIGVDVNDELIRKSVQRAERLGSVGLNFACGKIDASETKSDIVFALHACDTATDDAIALTVKTGAKLLLSVPCCHHHLNDSIHPKGPAEVLRPMLRHGILQQRTADLATDAFRALLLRIMGYRTDVVEFVSPEHTSRNLMIRAVGGLPPGEPTFVKEYEEMKRFWNATPYLEKLLSLGR